MIIIPLLALTSTALVVSPSAFGVDALDDYVKAQMSKYGVPGLSMAIVSGGKIVETRCYGVLGHGTRRAVTPDTLFQAGSISKSVAAVGALRLVEQAKLALDEDVNVKLQSWKVPENQFTTNQKVTLRRILSHTAGMTVHGFPGYAIEASLPTLIQVLNGDKPANTPSIVVEKVPGTAWQYSGGGYTVMQQLILDVTGEPFPDFMRNTVLGPAGMADSSYEQPQPPSRAARTACGTYPDGQTVTGRWHIYPEMAAAGLWTTPTDLAKFVISIQSSYAGSPSSVLQRPTAVKMLSVEKDGDGLGTFLGGKETSLQFSHNGRDEGFDALYIGYAKLGFGAAIMINANENSGMINRIVQHIGAIYNWPDYPRPVDISGYTFTKLDAKKAREIVGYYSAGDQTIALSIVKGRLQLHSGTSLVDELLPEANGSFLLPDVEQVASFVRSPSAQLTELTLSNPKGKDVDHFPRICGLLAMQRTMPDPDTTRPETVQKFFQASVKGGDPIRRAPYLTPGAQRDFGGGIPDMKGFQSTEYLGENHVPEGKIVRHGSKVVHVVEYRIKQSGKTHFAIVYYSDDNLITDFDLVQD